MQLLAQDGEIDKSKLTKQSKSNLSKLVNNLSSTNLGMIKLSELQYKLVEDIKSPRRSGKTSNHLQNLETQLLASLTIGTAFPKPN